MTVFKLISTALSKLIPSKEMKSPLVLSTTTLKVLTWTFKLDENQETEIKTYVLNVVRDAIKQATTSSKPYLNRKEIAKYFGVADSTITYWASLGMPVANIDGRKLYGKQSITNWLKDHEMPSIKAK